MISADEEKFLSGVGKGDLFLWGGKSFVLTERQVLSFQRLSTQMDTNHLLSFTEDQESLKDSLAT